MPERCTDSNRWPRASAISALLLLTSLLGGNRIVAQEAGEAAEPEPMTELLPPRDNSEFIGVPTTATATRRFEMYNPHSKQSLQALKDMGFTQVILDWPNLSAEAAEIGLDVVLANWWTDKTSSEEIDRALAIGRAVERGRLAGISVMDEPERNSPDTPFAYYAELYETLRARLDHELPGVRLEISHWGPLATWDQRYYDYFSILYEAADVMRIMPFPDLHEGPLDEVYLMMLRSREVMSIADRELPLVVILQTWVLPPRSELPEVAELRVMAWQAMLAGAETISFFDYNLDVWEQTPGFHDRFAELMQELTELSTRLRDATIESSMSENGILSAKATWPSGRFTTILVNTNRTSVEGLEPLAIVMSPEEPLTIGALQQGLSARSCKCRRPCPLSSQPCRAGCSNPCRRAFTVRPGISGAAHRRSPAAQRRGSRAVRRLPRCR